MLIKKLTLDNYKTYYGNQELDVYIPSESDKNIILIGGLNGSGKTTILKAIHYALYGKRGMSSEEHQRLFSNVINNSFFDEGGRDCSITLIIENEKKEEWHLKTVWSFDNYKRVVSENREIAIRKPGATHSQKIAVQNLEAFNRLIDRMIPYFASRFFIFDGEEIKDTILRQNSHEMRGAIQKITGLDAYKDLLKDLRLLRDQKQFELGNLTSTSDLRNLHSRASKEQEKIDELVNKLKKYKTNIQEVNNEIQHVKSERSKKIQSNHHSRSTLLTEHSKIESDLANKNDHFKTMFEATALNIILKEKIASMINRIKLEKSVTEHDLKAKATLKPYYEFMEQLFKESIEPALLPNQLNQIKSIGEEIWLRKNDLNNPTVELDDLWHDLSPSNVSKLLYRHTTDSTDDIILQLNNIERLKNKLAEISLQIENAPEFSDISSETNQLDDLLKKAGQFQLRYKSINSQYKTRLEEKAKITAKIEKLSKQTTDINEVQLTYNHLQKLINGFEDYIEQSTKLKSDFISEEFSKMLLQLFRKNEEFGQIIFDTETFMIRLYNDRNQEISVYDRSAGEMQMISSALIWALTKASDLNLPMVIDTPLGRLDSVHRNHLINHYFKHLSKQVIILSTDTEITKDYVQMMELHSHKQFMLDYNQDKRYTAIRDGYFDFSQSKEGN